MPEDPRDIIVRQELRYQQRLAAGMLEVEPRDGASALGSFAEDDPEAHDALAIPTESEDSDST